jgi:hypothetical protein
MNMCMYKCMYTCITHKCMYTCTPQVDRVSKAFRNVQGTNVSQGSADGGRGIGRLGCGGPRRRRHYCPPHGLSLSLARSLARPPARSPARPTAHPTARPPALSGFLSHTHSSGIFHAVIHFFLVLQSACCVAPCRRLFHARSNTSNTLATQYTTCRRLFHARTNTLATH